MSELMTAKTARRFDGPQLGEIERLCFNQLNEKLDGIDLALRGIMTKQLHMGERLVDMLC